jgi:PEP-CTERM motif-containing protein
MTHNVKLASCATQRALKLRLAPTQCLRQIGFGATMAALFLIAPVAVHAAVFDNFSDLNDTVNPTWTHLSGYVNSTGQAWDASTGQYRFTAPNNGAQALGFIGSHTGPSFSNVNVSADITNFVGPPAGAVFGVAARLNGNNAVGGLTGYSYAYEPFAAGGAGEAVLYRINPGVSITDIGSQQVTLNPAKDYRFVLDIQGSTLHGQIFEIGGGMVAERFAIDNMYASGTAGLIAYSQNPVPPVDVTWDNFRVQVPEPSTVLLIALGAWVPVLGRRIRGAH